VENGLGDHVQQDYTGATRRKDNLSATTKVLKLVANSSQTHIKHVVKELKDANNEELQSDGFVGVYAFILKTVRLAKNYYYTNKEHKVSR
jgi:copper oxidase (laccase) domain-containing protein